MLWTGILIGLGIGLAAAALLLRPLVRRQELRARAAERRARDAQRLAEIGAMTGGLAHEIKNPLSTIGLNAQLLGEGIGELEGADEHDKARLQRRIDTLRREVERLRDILQDFLNFAGSVRVEPRPTDLNRLVEELVDFYQAQAEHHGVRLRAELAPSSPAPMAQIDARHFKQAVLNLMINATQAMDAANPLAQQGSEPARPKELILRIALAAKKSGRADPGNPGSWELHVIDTGPGIAPEVVKSIFTPYFTTKSGGSGLGLPTARRLIEEHGGTIEVVTEPGKGSDFVVRVPRA